jgi:hypothetical protein
MNASYYVPESVVNHWCNFNVGADIVNTPIERMERFQYMYRNDVCMYRQDGIEGYFYLAIRNILHMIRIITKSDYKKEKLRILINGTKKGLQFYPEIQYPERL